MEDPGKSQLNNEIREGYTAVREILVPLRHFVLEKILPPPPKWENGLKTHKVSSANSPVPARIVNISSSVTVNEGSNVNLLCLAVGKPEPTVIWRQMKDGFTSEGEYLEITDINRQQAGEYECITENGVLVPDRKHVLITVNYPPTITDVKDSHPPIGKMALLRCEAMAVPPAEFQWFKDDKQLIGGSDGMQIQNERTRSILLFTNVTARHYGNYTCLASNHLGSFNVSLRLIRPGSLENMAAANVGSSLFLGLLSSAFVTVLFKI
ncbi:IgLON family member 5 [Varanus komodoensis]|nr:IgLON family member 5 [Varanus komodoensis]